MGPLALLALIIGGWVAWRSAKRIAPGDLPSLDDVRRDLGEDGYSASMRRQRASASRLAPYRPAFEAAGRKHDIPPEILMGIASVESGGDVNALGDDGHAHSLMQVHDRHHPEKIARWVASGRDPAVIIDAGAEVLSEMRRTLQAQTDLSGQQLLRASIAAYNAGAGNVLNTIRSGGHVDSPTTGRHYSANVIARAHAFRQASVA